MALDDRRQRERAANARARDEGRPLPYPNIWDSLDPTKVDPGASPEQITASYRAFTAICRPRPCRKYTL